MGGQGSGGLRPSAPQNNFGVSATGGNGNKGQPVKVAPGGKYGERTAAVEQQSGAPMSNAGAPTSTGAFNPMPSPIHPLTSPEGASGDHVTTGVDFGRGAGSEALPTNLSGDPRRIENAQIIKQYLPSLLEATKLPSTPDSFKRFVNYLLGQQ